MFKSALSQFITKHSLEKDFLKDGRLGKSYFFFCLVFWGGVKGGVKKYYFFFTFSCFNALGMPPSHNAVPRCEELHCEENL